MEETEKVAEKVDGNEWKKDINSINTIDNYAAHQSNYGVKMLTLIGNHLREREWRCSIWYRVWSDETSSIDAFRTRLISWFVTLYDAPIGFALLTIFHTPSNFFSLHFLCCFVCRQSFLIACGLLERKGGELESETVNGSTSVTA